MKRIKKKLLSLSALIWISVISFTAGGQQALPGGYDAFTYRNLGAFRISAW
jgi:hypothetical protein